MGRAPFAPVVHTAGWGPQPWDGSSAIASGRDVDGAMAIQQPHDLLGLNADSPRLSMVLYADAGKVVKGAGIRGDDGAVR